MGTDMSNRCLRVCWGARVHGCMLVHVDVCSASLDIGSGRVWQPQPVGKHPSWNHRPHCQPRAQEPWGLRQVVSAPWASVSNL